MMKKIIYLLATIVLAVACDKEPSQTEVTDSFEIAINMPTSLKTYPGAEVTFDCEENKGVKLTDKVTLKAGTKELVCKVTSSESSKFKIVMPDDLETASYFFWVERNGVSKKCGTLSVVIVDEADAPTVDYNITGKVSAGGVGLEGVVVSDGVLVTTTDKNGVYYLDSQKKYGYVFISIPSGYEVVSSRTLPQFYKYLKGDIYEVDEANFSLTSVGDQTNHIMYVIGDLHLAARNDDVKQFRNFCDDLNAQLEKNAGRKQYAMTLGDMTWELYWGNYDFDNYLTEMGQQFNSLQVFNTIGNHDHAYDGYAGDFDTVLQYIRKIGPTYYSFNIGNVHYIVLDDILCKNTGAGTSESRIYSSTVTDEQIDWLKKDLAYVDKSSMIVVASHAPLYSPSNATSFKTAVTNASEIIELLGDYKEVHYFTGHTHENYNVDKLSSSDPHFEHNAGSICATWWWTYKTCGINIARDGAPGGYTICEFDGTDLSWIFKAYDRDEDYQFRSYDLNKVDLSKADADKFKAYSSVADNSILINIWNWDPEWKLSVKENGKELGYTQIYNYDPLHILGYTMVRGSSSTSSFLTHLTPHLFLIQASSATSTLEINVTDRFGNTYSEQMSRPKDFKTETYK